MNNNYGYFLLGALIVIADRLTKYCVMHHQSIQHFLGITLVPSINRGLSWSLFSSDNTLIYFTVSCTALLFFSLLCWYTFKRYKAHYTIWSEVMIIAGACSNLIDRYVYQGVVDFINIDCWIISWPSFNIADVAICLGALHIMFVLLYESP